jgi:hypothetical protein
VKVTTIAHHAHGGIRDIQPPELQLITLESIFMRLEASNGMKHMVDLSELFQETDTAQVTENLIWELEAFVPV